MNEFAERKTFRLSRRLSVEITVGLGGMTAEWSPAAPSTLTGKELRAYRRARDGMLATLAERIGGNVLVVEL